MQYVYLLSLLISFAGILTIDYRHQLAIFLDAVRTGITVAVGVVFFILWDIVGIWTGIFFSGESRYMSGIYLGPEFPLEELLFLSFLCYFTLVVYNYGVKKWQPTS